VLDLEKVAPFLLKLYEIVSSPASDDLVCWSEHGETFKIVNRTKFAGDVLPLYFKHDNLRSFIRQLNIYGFQRCTNAPGSRDNTMEFFHPSFTRNGASDLKDIKRGNQVKSSKRQDMEETSFHEGPDENSSGISQNGHKRPRIDYSVFHSDVARLQQNLDDLETDLKQHSMQVQQKLALILRALDDTPVPRSLPSGVAADTPGPRLEADCADEPSYLMPKGVHSATDEAMGAEPNGALERRGVTSGGMRSSTTSSTQSFGAVASMGSSGDLATAYLAAAGHHIPTAEVLESGHTTTSRSASVATVGLPNDFGERKRMAATGLPTNLHGSLGQVSFNASPAGFDVSLTVPYDGGTAINSATAGVYSGGRWCDGWGTSPTPSDGRRVASYSRAELLPSGSPTRRSVPGIGLIGGR